jgi:hypothetical protein
VKWLTHRESDITRCPHRRVPSSAWNDTVLKICEFVWAPEIHHWSFSNQDWKQNLTRENPRIYDVKITVLWGVKPCSLVNIHWRFQRIFCLHLQGRKWDHSPALKFEGAHSVNMCRATVPSRSKRDWFRWFRFYTTEEYAPVHNLYRSVLALKRLRDQ